MRYIYDTGPRLSFNEIVNLNKGDTIFEVEYGAIIKAKLLAKPIVTTDGDLRKVTFAAECYILESSGWLESSVWKEVEEVNYLVSENYMSYGPKLHAKVVKYHSETYEGVELA